MNKEYIMFFDVNDMKVFIPIAEVNRVISEEALTLFGMDMATIAHMARRKGKSKIQGMKMNGVFMEESDMIDHLREGYNVKDEMPSDFVGKVYAIGSDENSHLGYKQGPTSNIGNLLSEIGEEGDIIYDITSPLTRTLLYYWLPSDNKWKKYDKK